MTNHELQELGTRLAQEFDIDRHKHWNEDGSNRITHLVRAAVAHGLRMGADTCERQAMRWRDTVGKNYVAHECKAACRALAEEIEAAR